MSNTSINRIVTIHYCPSLQADKYKLTAPKCDGAPSYIRSDALCPHAFCPHVLALVPSCPRAFPQRRDSLPPMLPLSLILLSAVEDTMNAYGDALPYIGLGALVPSPTCLPPSPFIMPAHLPHHRPAPIIVPDNLYYGRSFYCGYKITRQHELSEKSQK